MKLYRLHNLTLRSPASGLYFFRREGAEELKELIKWPYANDGRWPLPEGHSIPLKSVELLTEAFDMPVTVSADLDMVVFEQGGQTGGAPLLPADCFDPDEWRAAGDELKHPIRGTYWKAAQLRLRDGREQGPAGVRG